jgi:hypothetical protein
MAIHYSKSQFIEKDTLLTIYFLNFTNVHVLLVAVGTMF